MDIIQAVILGIIEGLTEFLPISSTGHLIVVADWLGVEPTDQSIAFKVIIQVAAIFAVVGNYSERFHPRHLDLWSRVFIAFLPIAVIGFLFGDLIETFFVVQTVAWMFIIGGIVFLVLEHYYDEDVQPVRSMDQIGYRQAGWVGFAQIFAVIPGTSRAGATIVGGMLTGMNRKTSAEFSFLLALPVLLASAGLLIRSFIRLQEVDRGFDTQNVISMVVRLPFARYREDAQLVTFFDQAMERLQRLPGVRSAGTVNFREDVKDTVTDYINERRKAGFM